jgi:hypothetical protein
MFSFALAARTFGVLASLAILLTILGGCSSMAPTTGNAIVGHWVHSYEEDSLGVQAYRPSAYRFPPSRGREGWEFRDDGTAIRWAIAAADGAEADSGRWSLSDARLLTITTKASALPFRYTVVHVDSSLLKLQILR